MTTVETTLEWLSTVFFQGDEVDALPCVAETASEEEEGPAPRTKRAACVECGDPNYSLEGDVCIACRICLRPGR